MCSLTNNSVKFAELILGIKINTSARSKQENKRTHCFTEAGLVIHEVKTPKKLWEAFKMMSSSFSVHSSTHWKILLEKSLHTHSQIQPCSWRLTDTFHQLQFSYLPKSQNPFSGSVAIFWHFKSSLWKIFSKSRAEMEQGINKEIFCLILAVYLQIQKPFSSTVSCTYPKRWVWFT